MLFYLCVHLLPPLWFVIKMYVILSFDWRVGWAVAHSLTGTISRIFILTCQHQMPCRSIAFLCVTAHWYSGCRVRSLATMSGRVHASRKNICITPRCSKWGNMLHCEVIIIAFLSKFVKFFIYGIAEHIIPETLTCGKRSRISHCPGLSGTVGSPAGNAKSFDQMRPHWNERGNHVYIAPSVVRFVLILNFT